MLHEEVHEQLCQLPRIPGIEAEDLTSGNVTFFKAGAFMPKCRDEMARHLSSAASATKALSKPAGMPITFIWFFRCDLIPTGRFFAIHGKGNLLHCRQAAWERACIFCSLSSMEANSCWQPWETDPLPQVHQRRLSETADARSSCAASHYAPKQTLSAC